MCSTIVKSIVRLTENEDLETAMKIVLADKTIDGLLCLEERPIVSIRPNQSNGVLKKWQ
jgi:hypothetical protein